MIDAGLIDAGTNSDRRITQKDIFESLLALLEELCGLVTTW